MTQRTNLHHTLLLSPHFVADVWESAGLFAALLILLLFTNAIFATLFFSTYLQSYFAQQNALFPHIYFYYRISIQAHVIINRYFFSLPSSSAPVLKTKSRAPTLIPHPMRTINRCRIHTTR